jgi:hypothetical protein
MKPRPPKPPVPKPPAPKRPAAGGTFKETAKKAATARAAKGKKPSY